MHPRKFLLASGSKKPWPIRWVVISILGFIALNTYVGIKFRKEDGAHHPYEEAQVRSAHELRDSGWTPFPNAYWLPGDSEEQQRAPNLTYQNISVENILRNDPRVSDWSDKLPPLEQGEQVAKLEAPEVVPAGSPYIARLTWEVPENFQAPQLMTFRRGRTLLIIPRAPERGSSKAIDRTLFVVPPDFIEKGEYEVLLSTEGLVNRWTFKAE